MRDQTVPSDAFRCSRLRSPHQARTYSKDKLREEPALRSPMAHPPMQEEYRWLEDYSTGESSCSIALRTILIGACPCSMKLSWNLLQAEGCTLLPLEIFAKLHDLELAKGVVEVDRVGGSALGFDHSDGTRLVAILYEEVDCLIDGPGGVSRAPPGRCGA